MIRLMSRIQIHSVESPFDSQSAAREAVGVISTADAMGLLGEMEVSRLDLATFRRVVDRIAVTGIGAELQTVLHALSAQSEVPDIHDLLARLALAMEESPAPEHEWRSLAELFGAERLAALLGISPASVHRYQAGTRRTPDEIADHLHFLATVVGDLAGAYNEFGIRRWFERPRELLDGKTPAELLQGDWSSQSPSARRVRELARSLGASAAT